MKGLAIRDLHKSFGEVKALDGISFEVSAGEIVAVLGPSGCGKSTLLALIAGLEPLDQGEIYWDGVSQANVPTHQRGFGLMFQDYMLFPHRNVYKNVAFGLEMLHWEIPKIEKQVARMLDIVGLAAYGKRSIHTLSGGEQQRVALARSLAPNPRLLMLDEPFSSLDRALREGLITSLRQILKTMNQTALYITHDQEEAFGLADRVVVMQAGKAVQIGTPEEIYHQPASEFVARFLGFKNIFRGEILNGQLQTPFGQYPIRVDQQGRGPAVVSFLLRPDAAILSSGEHPQIRGVVRARSFRGGLSLLQVESDSIRLSFEFQSGQPLPEPGESICLSFNPVQALQLLS